MSTTTDVTAAPNTEPAPTTDGHHAPATTFLVPAQAKIDAAYDEMAAHHVDPRTARVWLSELVTRTARRRQADTTATTASTQPSPVQPDGFEPTPKSSANPTAPRSTSQPSSNGAPDSAHCPPRSTATTATTTESPASLSSNPQPRCRLALMGEPAPHFTPPRNPQTNDQTTVGHAFGPPHSGILTSMDTPLTGTIDQVTDQALKLARAGDHRARPAHINGKRGILTPHTTSDGQLDADDLAAQVYALTLGLASDTGSYTGGHFTADGLGYYSPAPADLDEPTSQ